ncbi:hypothetical protein [Proteiniphilum sp. X52]|uniref:hypothetical protein n=1 Tax=Proteiniphilum sp. X52 TaxID=2382159 RepID=UPI0013148EF1|nr:hypothetical protein [Proteiniphilum sp. X52]
MSAFHFYNKASNTEKSRIRSIGIKRATAIIGLKKLTYNMYSKIQLLALQRDNYALPAS